MTVSENVAHGLRVRKVPEDEATRGKVSFYSRPDPARLAEVAAGIMRGEVVTAHFLGEKTRIVIQVGDENLINLELPSSERVAPGATIGTDLPPESLLVFGEA